MSLVGTLGVEKPPFMVSTAFTAITLTELFQDTSKILASIGICVPQILGTLHVCRNLSYVGASAKHTEAMVRPSPHAEGLASSLVKSEVQNSVGLEPRETEKKAFNPGCCSS